MPWMYCSHVAYCTTLRCSNSHNQSSTQEILVGRGGAIIFLNVPTFTTSRLPSDPSSQRWNYVGEKWPMNFVWNARLPRSIQESFTCRKSTTWDRLLYFPSEGRRAENFFALKNPTVSAGFEPANLGTKGQHATSRPPKPLYLLILFIYFLVLTSLYLLKVGVEGYCYTWTYWMTHTHIIRRTPLDEESARHRDLSLTIHDSC